MRRLGLAQPHPSGAKFRVGPRSRARPATLNSSVGRSQVALHACDITRASRMPLTFPIPLGDVRPLGHDLHRPECVVACRDGSVFVPDWRGGVTRIRPDGLQESLLPAGLEWLRPNSLTLEPDGASSWRISTTIPAACFGCGATARMSRCSRISRGRLSAHELRPEGWGRPLDHGVHPYGASLPGSPAEPSRRLHPSRSGGTGGTRCRPPGLHE
jgi:hypothetical protein